MEKNNNHNNDNLGAKQPSPEGGKMATENHDGDFHGRGQADNRNNFNSETKTQGDEEEEEAETQSNLDHPNRSSSRTPFTNLSQIDADLALARTLQEQERAYMMLRMNHDGSDYGSWEAGSYLHDEEDEFDDPNDDTDGDEDEDDEYDGTDLDGEEESFDVLADNNVEGNDSATAEVDPNVYSTDEAYARALQEAEEREMAARLLALAGINDRVEDVEDHGHNSQDAWEEVDPDELSYEELLALSEIVGTESRGLSADSIASLPSIKYKTGSSQNGSNDSCVICRLDYEDGETLTLLSCKHSYHSECINNWLNINKVCPVCSTEVSTSGHS